VHLPTVLAGGGLGCTAGPGFPMPTPVPVPGNVAPPDPGIVEPGKVPPGVKLGKLDGGTVGGTLGVVPPLTGGTVTGADPPPEVGGVTTPPELGGTDGG
jgi:hypothetical protein